MVDPGEVEGAASAAHAAAIAGAAAEELSGQGGDVQTKCANCGHDLHGRYCSSCGQVADLFHRPIWSLIADGLEGLFSLEGRFFRTVFVLMIWPGRVSRNYLSGARARYMAPFRLFLFASVILFVAIFAATGDLKAVVNNGEPASAEELAELRARLDSEVGTENEAARAGVEAAVAGIEARRAGDDGVAALSNEKFKCTLRAALLPEDAMSAACLALEQGANQDANQDPQEEGVSGFLDLPHRARTQMVDRLETAIDDPAAWVAAVQRWAPRLVFFLFPVYALLLALTHFWRRKVFLYDHIVVSLHFHSFLFILVLAWLALSYLLPAAILVPAAFVWSNFALYRTLRLVYADSRFGSITRVILLDFAYLIVLAISVVSLAALGVAFI